jgi:glycosyltransferase involved in cell wall biosynthesis
MIDERVPFAFETAVLKYQEETKGLVSVIIPIYNGELYMRDALDSVIAQTFENWEAVLVDDGSTDKTSEICAEYVKKDSRFKYVRKENNEGLLLARKTGLENSKGEFIANLDHDDVYHPQFLEKMFAKMKTGDNDFVWCNFEDLNGKETVLYGKDIKVKDCKLGECKLENCRKYFDFGNAFLWNKLIKRYIYAKVLFPLVKLVQHEDMIQHLQIVYHSERAELVDNISYRLRINSITSTSRAFSVVSKENRYVYGVICMVSFYLIAEHLFGTQETEENFADQFVFLLGYYFLPDKKTFIRHKMEYAQNFIPMFSKSVTKTKYRNFRWVLLVLACKGFPQPFRIYCDVKRMLNNVKARLKREKI